MKKNILLLILLAAVFAKGEPPADNRVTAAKVVEIPGYSEGVVFDRAGNAYISHQQRRDHRVTPDGARVSGRGRARPTATRLADGTHLVCDASQHAVLRLDADGKVIGRASSECDGKPLRGPNDLTLDPKRRLLLHRPGRVGQQEADRHRPLRRREG